MAAVTSLAQEIGASSRLLDYYASSDISADDSISVGYAGILLY
ncbi:MAG: hypothetical protein LBE27_08185 [Deltaproteobacteria bacterium]|nr:hypothetical protein [Deltaproteobacteria bacterium]